MNLHARSRHSAVILFAVLALPLGALAHPAADEMAAAATKFLAALNAEQKAKATYEFKSEARQQWHFIPTEMVTFGRKGVPFLDLNEQQRALGLALLKTGLSEQGYGKATNIMSLEAVLRAIEN